MSIYTMDHTGDFSYAKTIDGAYIGDEKTAKFLCDKMGVFPELITENHQVCSIGFNPKTQRWHGWSHRAISDFGIGSKVKLGDFAYIADTPEELIDNHVGFWVKNGNSEQIQRALDECKILEDKTGIRILHTPTYMPMAASAEELADVLDSGDISALPIVDIAPTFTIVKCGRGEWEAKTTEDAKQMAIDFANSVG